MTVSTFNTYPDLISDGGRHARTDWPGGDLAAAVAATLSRDPSAIVSRAVAGDRCAVGHLPGGLA